MCNNKNELRSAVAKYRKAQALKSEAERMLDEAKSDIFEYLETHGVEPKEKVTGQNFVLSFSICRHTSFDADLLKGALGDDLSPFQKQTEYSRLTIR